MASKAKSGGELGTRDHPWQLKTPSGTAEFTAFRDPSLDPPALVVKSGSTELRYHLRCIEDLHSMLKAHGDWMPSGARTSRSRRPKGRWKPGADHGRIRLAVGTD